MSHGAQGGAAPTQAAVCAHGMAMVTFGDRGALAHTRNCMDRGHRSSQLRGQLTEQMPWQVCLGCKDAETRDRTGDLQIFSLTLSQLSYRSLA